MIDVLTEGSLFGLHREKCIANYVSKFREDNIDWKYWMPPLLEMWQKKLELKEQRSKKNGPDKDNKKVSVYSSNGILNKVIANARLTIVGL